MPPDPPFDDAYRREVATRLSAFARDASADPARELKPAAVAIALLDSGDGSGASFVLTRRAAHLRAHGGQWALPGGRRDEGETAVDAALRELDEEIGLRLPACDVLGVLDDYPTRSGYLVTPVVVWAAGRHELRPNPHEVESVHRIGLAQIARVDAVDFTSIPQSGRRVVRIRIDGSLVHAPTAAILYQFREVLAGRATRVFDLEQPLFAWR